MISGFWRVSSGLLAAMLLLPMATVAGMALFSPWDDAVFVPVYIFNSLALAVGAVLFSLLLALPPAWVMARYRFAGQRALHWALLTPLALPPYLLAAVYGELGLMPTAARLAAGGFCLALTSFPWLYLLARDALLDRPASYGQAARLLGAGRGRTFRRVSLPLARPALTLGMALTAADALGDYGLPACLSLPTLVTAGLELWRDRHQYGAAAQLLLATLPLALLLGWLAHRGRFRRLRYQRQGQRGPDALPRLQGWPRRLTLLAGWGLAAIGSGVPLGSLLYWSCLTAFQDWAPLAAALGTGLLAACCATLLILALAALCLADTHSAGEAAYASPLGWAGINRLLPGALLGMGVVMPFLPLTAEGATSAALIALTLVPALRFHGVPVALVQARMARTPPVMERIARVLGYTPGQRLWRVHLPLLQPTLLAGVALAFADSLRELNAALLLQPFKVETLASYVFQAAADGRLPQTALPALLLAALGVPALLGAQRWLGREES